MKSSFAHLRVSSEYSIFKGLLSVEKLVEKAKSFGMPAIALTDHSNMFGLVKFFKKCEKEGIKPISGSTLNIARSSEDRPYEFLCLAKNIDGHKNLMHGLSKASRNQSKGILYDDFLNICNDIFVITGSENSEIFSLILNDKENEAVELIEKYKADFKNNFVIEIQNTGKESHKIFMASILPIASRLSIPVIATNDVLFGDREDFEIHETKVCINSGKTLNDPNREKIYSEEQYFKSQDEMQDLFGDFPDVLSNTLEIAKQCNLSIEPDGYFLPEYPVPDGQDFDTHLKSLVEESLDNLIAKFDNDKVEEYKARVKYELDQIKTMGFSSYFLIVYDFIKWSKNNDVPVGPGRGSGAGSLVAFCLGITALDPIKHGLLFERFLNPERISMPDFDIDFCMEKRDKVIEYVSSKYGKDAVSQIVTFGTMAARGVVRDVTRALGKPYSLGDRISKMIPFEIGMTLEKAISRQPVLKQAIKDDEEVQEIMNLSFKLEGGIRNIGKHAGGVVIAPGSLSDFSPIYFDSDTSSVLTQFDKDDVEKIGLVKFDFLGLRTLTIIDKAIKSINDDLASQNKDQLDISNIDLNDSKVFELLSAGKTTAVFQLESPGMKDLIKRLKPTKFEEIVALLALFRPGPLDSGMHDEFVNRKNGKVPVTYPHKLLEPVLSETYGVILYQEQVMESARVLAGYSLGQADILRRAMGKKQVEEMDKQRTIFVNGCKDNNIKEDLANKIFNLIETFAGYGFNKSHSAAYALLSFQTAYLKTYYPEYFMAAVLSSAQGNTDKISSIIKECKDMNISVLSPNILTSGTNFFVNPKKQIEYGLTSLKGVAESFIYHLSDIREKHTFKNLLDFSKKVNVKLGGKKSLESLSKAGAFDSICDSRSIALACIPDMLKEGDKKASDELFAGDLFSNVEEDFNPYDQYKDVNPLNFSQKLKYEKEALGFYISGHPVEAIKDDIKDLRSHKISDLDANTSSATIVGLVNSTRQIKDSKNKPITFVNFDDETGSMDGIILSDLYEEKYGIIQEDTILKFYGSVEVDDYRSRETNSTMYRMRVKNINAVESDLVDSKKDLLIICDTVSGDSLQEIKLKLNKIDPDFWGGESKVKLKILKDSTEALISLNDNFMIDLNSENLDNLRSIFGDNKIKLS
ncbi:MAG: DNA-directed DNA polymerase [Gammaproteobacteria bacterium]|nr:MAG: DNA-directed DNA polymerase [Gammaproteobacteria bacterium]